MKTTLDICGGGGVSFPDEGSDSGEFIRQVGGHFDDNSQDAVRFIDGVGGFVQREHGQVVVDDGDGGRGRLDKPVGGAGVGGERDLEAFVVLDKIVIADGDLEGQATHSTGHQDALSRQTAVGGRGGVIDGRNADRTRRRQGMGEDDVDSDLAILFVDGIGGLFEGDRGAGVIGDGDGGCGRGAQFIWRAVGGDNFDPEGLVAFDKRIGGDWKVHGKAAVSARGLYCRHGDVTVIAEIRSGGGVPLPKDEIELGDLPIRQGSGHIDDNSQDALRFVDGIGGLRQGERGQVVVVDGDGGRGRLAQLVGHVRAALQGDCEGLIALDIRIVRN